MLVTVCVRRCTRGGDCTVPVSVGKFLVVAVPVAMCVLVALVLRVPVCVFVAMDVSIWVGWLVVI